MSSQLNILGVQVSAINLAQASSSIHQFISNRESIYVCVAPVASIIEAQDDPQFKEIMNNASMVTPDGMPLVWIGKAKGDKSIGRAYGPDLMLRVCDEGQEKGYRHFFYGGSQANNEKLIDNLKSKFPRINVVGHWAPPAMEKNQKESHDIITMINNTSADILWVGLGAPKQEYWMKNHRSNLNAPVMIGVGAAFDFISGSKRQAPRWMQRIGCEWLFRLLCEPKRLWRRYIVGNTRFIFLMFLSCFKPRAKQAQI